MLKIYSFEGKNEEELLEKALTSLNVKNEEVFVYYNKKEGKLFKLKKYELNILKKEDVVSFIKNYFSKISELMNIDINCEIKIRDDIINVNLLSSDNSIIIGKDGKTLTSIQQLLKQTLKNKIPFDIKINLDVSNYKSRKNKQFENEIIKIAKEVLKTKVDAKLDPMNSYERRLVHTIISKFENLETVSEGEEPNRYVIIKFKE
ncbi:MAG: KH domain-containing protein [Mollicutes bacterium]|nr:KH domain-containing protein [Mollicutes bacterium]